MPISEICEPEVEGSENGKYEDQNGNPKYPAPEEKTVELGSWDHYKEWLQEKYPNMYHTDLALTLAIDIADSSEYALFRKYCVKKDITAPSE